MRLKLAAYEFQKYGFLEGTVRTVSADSSSPDESQNENPTARQAGLAFKAFVELKDQRLGSSLGNFPIAAGMEVRAEIVQGKRTVLEYLLSPVQRVVGEAGMER